MRRGNGQLVFDFYDDEPRRPELRERLFFCVRPDTETARRIDQIGRQFIVQNSLKGRLLRAERFHVSLCHVGDYRRLRSEYLYAAKLVGAAISTPPFELRFGFIKSFEGRSAGGGMRNRPLVLLAENDAISELHMSLSAAMKKSGLRAVEHFTPHMTLSYGSRAISLQEIEPICFVVNEFVLIHSELWLTQYHVIDRWPLRATAAA
jgi:2'-5' RNA ligase